jgi:hypothetical protein
MQPEVRISQHFQVECAGLRTVRIWIQSAGADPLGLTSFRLLDHRDVIVAETHANAGLPAEGWFEMHFEPDRTSTGRRLELTIESMVGNPGIQVGYTQDEQYLEGNLIVGEVHAAPDLVFQYGCEVGLERFVSRLPIFD